MNVLIRQNIAFILLLFAALPGFILLSCKTAQLSNEWKDPAYNEGPMTSIMVIAIKKNPTIRRIWEDGFVNALARYGVAATPSYREFPDSLPDTSRIIESVKRGKFAGILFASHISTDTTVRKVPGYSTTEPMDIYNPWQSWYSVYYTPVYHPGYEEAERDVRYQVNLWTTKQAGQLVWSGTALVTDPSSSQDVNEQIVNRVVPELEKETIIPGKK